MLMIRYSARVICTGAWIAVLNPCSHGQPPEVPASGDEDRIGKDDANIARRDEQLYHYGRCSEQTIWWRLNKDAHVRSLYARWGAARPVALLTDVPAINEVVAEIGVVEEVALESTAKTSLLEAIELLLRSYAMGSYDDCVVLWRPYGESVLRAQRLRERWTRSYASGAPWMAVTVQDSEIRVSRDSAQSRLVDEILRPPPITPVSVYDVWKASGEARDALGSVGAAERIQATVRLLVHRRPPQMASPVFVRFLWLSDRQVWLPTTIVELVAESALIVPAP